MDEPIYSSYIGLHDNPEIGERIVIESPAGERLVEAKSLLAPRIADLTSRVRDLSRAIQFCEAHDAEWTEHGEPTLIMNALSEAAIMSYGRAFSRDIRSAASLSLDALDVIPGTPREVHAHFIHIRNKFLAHSENPYEDVAVGLSLSQYPSPPQVTGVFVAHIALTTFTGTQDLIRLSQAFIDHTEVEIKRLHADLFAEASQLEVSALYDRELLSYTMPPPEGAGTRRSPR